MNDAHHSVKIGQTGRGLRFDRRQELWCEIAKSVKEGIKVLSYPVVTIVRARIITYGKGCVHCVLILSEHLESGADAGSWSEVSDFFLYG
jgi:hypothetical protein